MDLVSCALAFDLAWALAFAPQLLRADPTTAGVDDGGRAASGNFDVVEGDTLPLQVAQYDLLQARRQARRMLLVEGHADVRIRLLVACNGTCGAYYGNRQVPDHMPRAQYKKQSGRRLCDRRRRKPMIPDHEPQTTVG